MTKYKGLIHVHTVYEVIVDAPSQALAQETVEDLVIQEDHGRWKEDLNAGWTDVIEVEEVTEDDIIEED